MRMLMDRSVCVWADGVENNRKWTVIDSIWNKPIRAAPISSAINDQWEAKFGVQDSLQEKK